MNNTTFPEELYPSRILDPIPITQTVLKSVCILLTVVGNGVVILAVITNKMLRQVPDNLFICSLAVTDFLIGVVVMAPDVIFMYNIYICRFIKLRFQLNPLFHKRVVLMLTSIWNLFIISYDRYHFIVHSLQYSTWMSGYKVPLFCIGEWFISIFFYLLFFPALFISPEEYPGIKIYNGFIVFIALVTPIVGLFVAYAKILCFTQDKAIHRRSETEKGLCKRVCNMRRTHVLSLIVCTSYILWCPHIAYLVLWAFTREKRCMFLEISAWFTFCNSLVNPLIYTIFNASFRKCMLSILKCSSLRRKLFGRELENFDTPQNRSRTRSFIDIMERPKVKEMKVDQTNDCSDPEVELPGHQISDTADDNTTEIPLRFKQSSTSYKY